MHNTKLKRILADSDIIFYEAFIGVTGNYPSVKYNDPAHHPFHHKIISNNSETQISLGAFSKWKNEVIEGFNDNNCLGVNISKVGRGS